MNTEHINRSLSTWMDQFLMDRVDRGALVGVAAMVIDRNGVIASAVHGVSSLVSPRRMQIDDVFWIASQTKPMTAVALMMLVDAGAVQLDDPVSKHLPRLAELWVEAEADAEHKLLRKASRPITLRDLLCHMSGMPFVSVLEQPTIDTVPLRPLVDAYALTPLLKQPGVAYQYSNMGINTIGRVIEVVSGESYEDFMKSRLFEPLGMVDTVFRLNVSQVDRLAHAHGPAASNDRYEPGQLGQLSYPLDDPARQAVPAGGLFSTAQDVSQFCRMLLSGGTLDGKRYLSPSAIAEMTRRQTAESVDNAYGLGWAVAGLRYSHAGAAGSTMIIDPVAGRAIVYMVQNNGFIHGGDTVQASLAKAVFDGETTL